MHTVPPNQVLDTTKTSSKKLGTYMGAVLQTPSLRSTQRVDCSADGSLLFFKDGLSQCPRHPACWCHAIHATDAPQVRLHTCEWPPLLHNTARARKTLAYVHVCICPGWSSCDRRPPEANKYWRAITGRLWLWQRQQETKGLWHQSSLSMASQSVRTSSASMSKVC